MRRRISLVAAAALVLLGICPLLAQNAAGTWTASFDTQIGVQNYTYTFQVQDGKLTGTAKSQFGETKISEGVVKGDEISFVENLDFQGQALRITYKGKVSGDVHGGNIRGECVQYSGVGGTGNRVEVGWEASRRRLPVARQVTAMGSE